MKGYNVEFKIIKILGVVLAIGVLLAGGCRKQPQPEPAQADQLGTVQEKAPVVGTSVEESKTGGITWITDFAAAKKKAAEDGKDLLINFTGSDWCGWCIRLDEEVFSKQLFAKEARTRFLFVKIDFPRKTSLPTDLKRQNDQLANEFRIQGFPTIVLADPEGKEYGRTGYQEGGPMAYLQHLAQLRLQRPAK